MRRKRLFSLAGAGRTKREVALSIRESRDRIFAEPKLYESLGTAKAIREQSRQRFGRSRGAIDRHRQVRF